MVQFPDVVNISFHSWPTLEKIYSIHNDKITVSSIHIAITAASFLRM